MSADMLRTNSDISERTRLVILISLFLLLSGAASLIYQVTWVRLLSLSIGSTSVSVSVVLGSFFMGLTLGSYLTTRLPARYYRSINFYLQIEAAIGISALLLLPVLLNLDQLVSAWPVLGSYLVFKVALVFLLLAIPCIAIGATYPLMASIIVREQSSIGENLGWLYSINTLGAVIGAVSVGFVLIPSVGLDGAIYVACGLNILIVVLGLFYRSEFSFLKQPAVTGAADNTVSEAKLLSTSERRALYAILFVTGFVALATEVGWTKYLAIFTRTTIYGFSAILAIFLTGIAAGAWLIKHYVDRIKKPFTWLVVLLCMLAFSLVLARVGLEYLPVAHKAITGPETSFAMAQLSKYMLIFLILIAPTLIFGALFTLNIRTLCSDVSSVHGQAGKAYAINTLGGIFGSVIAGLLVIPMLGTNTLLLLSVVFVSLLPLALYAHIEHRKLKRWLLGLVVVILVSNVLLPQLDFRNIIKASVYYFDPDARVEKMPDYPFIQEGRTGVISVTTYDNKGFRLQTNSLPEAVVYPPDAYPWAGETLLGLLPYLLHEQPEQGLLIGLGAGTTVSAAALSPMRAIEVVELEPAIAQANQYIFKDGLPALRDPRVTLTFNDARHHLLTGDSRYDAIVAQPSHPWLAGAANLFTQQYFELIESRLNQGGIFVQWLNLFNMDADTLASLYKSFYSAMPHGMSFIVRDESSLILVGSNQPIIFNFDRITQRLNEAKIKPVVGKWKIDHAYQLMKYFSLSRSEALHAAGDARPNTDTNLLTEIRLATMSDYAKSERSPFKLIDDNFNFNFTDHLDSNGKQERLEEIAKYYQEINDFRLQGLIREVIEAD